MFNTLWLVLKGCWNFWKDSDKLRSLRNSLRNSSVPRWVSPVGCPLVLAVAWDGVGMLSKGMWKPGKDGSCPVVVTPALAGDRG